MIKNMNLNTGLHVGHDDIQTQSYYFFSATIPQTTLQFFKPYVSRSGYQLLNRVQPISLILPGLRSDATFLERLAIKAKLVIALMLL